MWSFRNLKMLLFESGINVLFKPASPWWSQMYTSKVQSLQFDCLTFVDKQKHFHTGFLIYGSVYTVSSFGLLND